MRRSSPWVTTPAEAALRPVGLRGAAHAAPRSPVKQIRTQTSAGRSTALWRHRRAIHVLALALVPLMVTSCGASDSLGDANADLPRTMRYGALTLEFTDIQNTTTDPRLEPSAATETESTGSGQETPRFVGLDVTITNPLSDTSFDLPAGLFTMTTADGAEEDGFRVNGSSITLERTDVVSDTIWFELDPDADLSALTLGLEDGSGEPTRLPLSGDVTTDSVEIPIDSTTGGGEAAHGVSISIETDETATLTLNAVVDEDGTMFPGSGSCDASGVGRAPAENSFLVVPAIVIGNRPSTSSLPSLSFAAVNYGIPLQARADGVDTRICQSFGDLDTRREGSFVVLVPAGTESVEIISGCPCGGLLTGNEVENEFFRLSVSVTEGSVLFE